VRGRPLLWAIGAWAASLFLLCLIVHARFALTIDTANPKAVIASVWSRGELVGRAVIAHAGDRDAALDAAMAAHPGATLVYESVVGAGPVMLYPEAALALSFVPGRDGLGGTIGEHTAYVTPDELLARQSYDHGFELPGNLGVQTGLDTPIALALLADRLATTVPDLFAKGRIERIRVVRTTPGPTPGGPPAAAITAAITAESLSAADVRDGAIAAGRYLARGIDGDGRFRYLVDAPTNRTLPGYDWPRHAGATYFLAQVAALTHDRDVSYAALRAGSFLRDHAMVDCGSTRCIGSDPVVDLGSAALTVIAFVEIARTGLDPGYAVILPPLTAFLRGQQRPDGEFMHQYDRRTSQPIDIQLLYYSGEAALALARAHSLSGDARDLAAASSSVAYLAGRGWNFFGSRYYFGEEHWTCQAMDDLWARAPNPAALDFCLRWLEYGRALQYGPSDTAFDADGAYGVSPVITPRLTPAGSRSEAGIATLDAARRAGMAPQALAPLETQLRRALAMLLRHQLREGPGGASHLMADPRAVAGALPGSEVDWQLRIDYAQHTGSALLRWLEVDQVAAPAAH
jgi:hypothetical protein